MKNKIKKIINIILIVMLAINLVGCNGKVFLTTGLDSDQLLKVSGNVVPMSVGKLVLATEMNRYTKDLGEDIWDTQYEDTTLGEYLVDNVSRQLAELKAISMLAKDKNISLTSAEGEKIDAAAEAYYKTLSHEYIEKLGITQSDIRELYREFMISEKLYQMVCDSVSVEISDEEARVIKVQYIFVKTYYPNEEGNMVEYTSDGKVAAKNRIIEAQGKLNAGNDFAMVAEEYSDDAVYEYEFGRGIMEEAFEEAAFSLEQNELSDIVYADNGYYLIKCVNYYDQLKTEENKKQLLMKYKNQAFLDIYEPYLKAQSLEFNDNFGENYADDLSQINGNLYEIYSEFMEE